MNGATLKQVEKLKYLGVAFTSDGRQDEELDTRIGKASAVMRALHYSVVMKRELSKKAKLSIFRAVFVPILTYGHESWVMTERMRSQVQASRRVARNSQWGGCLGGLGTEPPAAGGQWGSGGEAPSCRRLGVWGQSPQPPEARGSGGRAPSARKFCIFLQK